MIEKRTIKLKMRDKKFLTFNKKPLSTSLIYIYKILIPIPTLVWIKLSFFLFPNSFESNLYLVISFLIIIVSSWLIFGSTKNICYDHDNLYVNGWFKSDIIPLENISIVYDLFLATPSVGLITLKKASKFGKRIKYFQKFRFIKFPLHPDIVFLKEAVMHKKERVKLKITMKQEEKPQLPFRLFAE